MLYNIKKDPLLKEDPLFPGANGYACGAVSVRVN